MATCKSSSFKANSTSNCISGWEGTATLYPPTMYVYSTVGSKEEHEREKEEHQKVLVTAVLHKSESEVSQLPNWATLVLLGNESLCLGNLL